MRGNCYSGSAWEPLNERSRAGPVCNCSSVGFQGFGCGQETALAYITPRSGPLEGGTLVTLFFTHLGIDSNCLLASQSKLIYSKIFD